VRELVNWEKPITCRRWLQPVAILTQNHLAGLLARNKARLQALIAVGASCEQHSSEPISIEVSSIPFTLMFRRPEGSTIYLLDQSRLFSDRIRQFASTCMIE
jgi:hypothetical protein